jgi:predicted AlkP superfamily phosphohydrolase/phosphomutase
MSSNASWLVWNVPMSFPPSEVQGAMMAGYGAPPGASITTPGSLQEEIASRWALADLLDQAPHSSLERFLEDLLRGLRVQGEALPWAARETGADCVAAVWPHIDRAQHFFWAFRDSDHPLGGAVDRIYEAMDETTGRVIDAFPDADVVVVSDHGAGTLRGDINVGAWLTENGHATPAGSARSVRSVLSSAAWALPPAARRLARRAAPGLARSAMSARLAGQLGAFDWNLTRAFFGVHSDLWINVRGREPHGVVDPEATDDLVREITSGLLGLEDPESRAPLFAAAHTRDQVFRGPYSHLAPEAILDSWSAGYRVAPGRSGTGGVVIRPEPLAGVDAAWSADHRPLGLFAARGPSIAAGAATELSLMDVCPTTLALLDEAIPEGLDGRVVHEALTPEFLAAHPMRKTDAIDRGPGTEDLGYSDDEAAAVAAHLKDLGYIE